MIFHSPVPERLHHQVEGVLKLLQVVLRSKPERRVVIARRDHIQTPSQIEGGSRRPVGEHDRTHHDDGEYEKGDGCEEQRGVTIDGFHLLREVRVGSDYGPRLQGAPQVIDNVQED